ncbi:hypothetical protein TraAM80_08445 [Trypanosoma rangeli]|uniref:Uncharacterized protein n=1 Tax=Trypanosoma rangeli TaxID=5698 RepID=A0A422N0V6_TRYRA|nr:uncharacterized protein TraAM80_08445 [Trypanosoma rangeli]RNE99095.1 hypothetical protein TraAM80_08445 [Trypanosoma rangeli]|eukprot:RNE99095.1 hypothetical protein TraAM80_08445 [Trypanosoma rangeli]
MIVLAPPTNAPAPAYMGRGVTLGGATKPRPMSLECRAPTPHSANGLHAGVAHTAGPKALQPTERQFTHFPASCCRDTAAVRYSRTTATTRRGHTHIHAAQRAPSRICMGGYHHPTATASAGRPIRPRRSA